MVDEAGANSSLFSEQIVESAISFQQEGLDTISSCHSGTAPVAWIARYGSNSRDRRDIQLAGSDRIKIRR
jgi:hypothetical protein